MLTAKKKISVRQAVPHSTSGDFFFTAQEWFKNNTKIVAGVALGIAAVIIVGYLYASNQDANELAANRELRKVQELYQQQQYRLAITGDPAQQIMGLEDIVKEYGGTPTGGVAAVYLGNAYLYSGDLDKALAAFEDASPDNDMLQAAVLAGKASVHEAKGSHAEAAELFERAATTFENELLSAERRLLAARNYAEAGDMEKTKELLLKVKESNTQRFQPDAERMLAQYGLDNE